MTNQTTKIDLANSGDEANSGLKNLLRLVWCAREDLNLHEIALTSS